MIPITRKELYLNKIVGNDDYSVPEKPISEEEFFFAAILGEAVQTPEPLSRYQIYLAKIAGRNISVPKPLTRLELFLAKACGMDIETPAPITREEIFWSNYTAIVEFEVEGVPPLTYKAIEGTLENYRIYGNTVGGESVGDRTGNLFDGIFLQGFWALADGAFMTSGKWICTKKIPCKANTDYTFTFGIKSRWYGIAWYDIDGNYIEFTGSRIESQPTIFTATSPANAAFMGIDIAGLQDSTGQYYYDIHPSDVTDFMLVEGSTPLPYEPYGYRVPVTVTNGTDTQTTNLYLPEQIKMVGDEAEYIDYAEQKMHRIGANDIDVTLPALPTIKGTNVLSVGTAVQPSKVYVKYKGERQ